MNRENNFFYEKLIFFAAIAAAVLAIVEVITASLSGKSFAVDTLFRNVLLILCLFFMVLSYSKHDKNLMNMMVGASLMFLLLMQFSKCFRASAEMSDTYKISSILNYALTVIFTLTFVNHLLITFRHNVSVLQANVGQLLLVLAIITAFAEILICLFMDPHFNFLVFLNRAIWYLIEMAVLDSLVAMEQQLNLFKQNKRKSE